MKPPNRDYYPQEMEAELGQAASGGDVLKGKLQIMWWRARERRDCGHSLNERWLHGQLLYH